jgi:putative CocE/NonD family hydrolase
MDDLFVNDDFHHGGALRLSYAFEYGYSLEKDRTKGSSFQHDRQDLYDWYLRLGALSHVDERYFHGEMPTWNALVAHPNHDAFWTSRAPSRYLAHAAIPTQNVAGWFDQEDFVGPMSVYATLERTDEARLDTLVVGPWNHGGWSRDPGRKLGDIDFGSDVTTDFKARFTRPFWAHCLHGAPDPKLPEAAIFETGRNVWRDLPAWPPKTGVTPTRLYLHAGRAASFDAPAGDEAPDAFVSDPSNPVPYRHRPIGPTYGAVGWSDWLVEDQRFVDHRPDVLTWETPPLDHDVEIGGELEADLYASTTGTDADWVVKLIDVLPEANDAVADPPSLRGYELMVASDILRGRFRDGLEAPKPVAAGEIVPYRVDLHTRAHAFLKGHRIMVQVQSTWFPLYDRNPQTYVDNVFRARDEDFTKATHTVVHDAAHPSSVVLPVVHWE